MKWLDFFASRLAWCCTMLCLALIGLVWPEVLMDILDDFSKDRNDKTKTNE